MPSQFPPTHPTSRNGRPLPGQAWPGKQSPVPLPPHSSFRGTLPLHRRVRLGEESVSLGPPLPSAFSQNNPLPRRPFLRKRQLSRPGIVAPRSGRVCLLRLPATPACPDPPFSRARGPLPTQPADPGRPR